MSQILEMRASIVARLRTLLPGVSIEEHRRAEFTTRDVEAALRGRHLALRVMFRGVQEDGTAFSTGEVDAPESWGIVIVAKDGKGTPTDAVPRDEKILNVLPEVLRAIVDDEWAVGGVAQKPRRILSNEMYGGDEDGASNSAMVWGVTWVQTVSIPPQPPTDLLPFLQLVTHYDLAPGDGEDDASDTISLPQDP